MTVGTILLTRSNKYVDDVGRLPERPDFDKGLLAGLVENNTVSGEGYDMLPPSIRKLTKIALVFYSFPITIRELAKADLLIVSRSDIDFSDGKEFRLDNFKCLVKDKRIEIWISIKRH